MILIKKLLVLLLLSVTLSGCSKKTDKEDKVLIYNYLGSIVDDVQTKVEYDGNSMDAAKGVQEVVAMESSIAYSDTEYVNTDDLPESLQTPIADELPAIQTALLSIVKKYSDSLGINCDTLSWQEPLSEVVDNHYVYLLKSVSSTVRIHLASTDHVVACIE